MADETTTTTTRRRREKPAPETIQITLTPVFGEVKTVRVPKDATVGEALTQLGYSQSVEVRCNGEGVLDKDMILEDGDDLAIATEGKVENGS